MKNFLQIYNYECHIQTKSCWVTTYCQVFSIFKSEEFFRFARLILSIYSVSGALWLPVGYLQDNKKAYFFFFLKWSNCNNIHWNFQWEFSLICVLWQGSLLSSHRKIGWKFKGVFAIVIRVSGWEDYWNMYFRYKTMRNGDGPYL